MDIKTTKNHLQKIKELYTTALTISIENCYVYNLDILIRDIIDSGDKISLRKFLDLKMTIIQSTKLGKITDEKFSPEQFSLDILGYNLFDFDNFDLVMIVYGDILDQINKIFDVLITDKDFTVPQCEKIYILKEMLNSELGEKPHNKNYRHKIFRNKTHPTDTFMSFLAGRELQLKNLNDEHDYLIEFFS